MLLYSIVKAKCQANVCVKEQIQLSICFVGLATAKDGSFTTDSGSTSFLDRT